MVLGRNGLRDERRRRALIDETLHGAASDASDSTELMDAGGEPVRARVKAYSEAANVAYHAPISVCIPKRRLALWGLLLLGGCVIAGIQALYAELFLRVPPPLQASLTALDLNARGSLASWFAAVVLCCGAMASLLVYLIRRHRTDDYRGRYRWWLWLSPLLLILSVNAGTGLHQVLSGVLTSVSGAEVALGGKGWWLIAYAGIFFPIVLQLAIDLWSSRLATAFFSGTIAAYLVVGAFEINAVQCATPLATVICHSSLLMSAHFGVLMTLLAYGRYVYLEAHDSLCERRRWKIRMPRFRRKKTVTEPEAADGAKAEATKSAAPARLRVDVSHSKFGQEAESTPQATVTSSALAADETATDPERKLSKADRKKLRRDGQRS